MFVSPPPECSPGDAITSYALLAPIIALATESGCSIVTGMSPSASGSFEVLDLDLSDRRYS